MKLRAPHFDASDPRRSRDARETFSLVLREAVVLAVSAGWREAEAALALADAAEDYVMFLSERPRRRYVAANSN